MLDVWSVHKWYSVCYAVMGSNILFTAAVKLWLVYSEVSVAYLPVVYMHVFKQLRGNKLLFCELWWYFSIFLYQLSQLFELKFSLL